MQTRHERIASTGPNGSHAKHGSVIWHAFFNGTHAVAPGQSESVLHSLLLRVPPLQPGRTPHAVDSIGTQGVGVGTNVVVAGVPVVVGNGVVVGAVT